MRVSRKEKIQLGYSMSPHIPSSPRRSSGIDFSDVFGGPPRRASMQEVQTRHDDDDDHTWRGDGDGDEEMVTGRSSWSVNPRENPVFGDEIVSRRRYPSQDFFNDIFRGDNPQSSSPRIGGRDPSCSSPSSRVMSPVRSLPPGAVPLGSPAPFSLSGYRRSPLSHKASADDDEELGKDIKVEGSGGGTRVPNGGGNQFHFSIHKWASKGMPLVMSLGKRNSLRSKIQLERSLSLNGSAELESDTLVGEIQPAGVNDDCLSFKVHVVSSATKESDPIADKVEESTPKEMKDVSKPDIEANKSDLKQSANKRDNISYQKNLGDDTAREKTEERVKEDTGKDKGKGKVKEFVKIFNQEPSLKPTADAAVGKTKSPSSRWRYNDESRVSSKSTLSSSKTDGKRQGFDVNFRLDSYSSPKVDGNHTPSSEKESEANNVQEPCQSFSIETDNFGSTMGSASDGLQASRSSIDVTFESFVIEELPEIQDKTSESREDNEDVRAYESKIQTWSKGKEGNIRALLSTLQYVLWPNSGWKPVPLVDIIEANAVKRSYQRALLYLHPDKLQQKGAASHHKFIAEKVFKILQEAWDQFNALGSL